MDPNEALRNLLDWAEDVVENHPEDAYHFEAAERVLALHEWISRGGFLPADWQRNRH